MPATVLRYGSLLLHMLAAIHAVMTRVKLRAISRSETLQMVSDLLMPYLLLEHISGPGWRMSYIKRAPN